METKPGFVLSRAKSIFSSQNNIELQQEVYQSYINKRNSQIEKNCYCGHTTDCDCANPSIEEFKHNLLNNNIEEKDLI